MTGREGPAPEDVQATYCATLVDEWLRRGVTHAVVAPGSRSTPMALALADRRELRIEVVHDERAAAFVALGAGLSGRPALLLCTSGTAAANFFPAVVEARLSEIPMIVLTADRPEELRGVGAPQTIDQLQLYGAHVRWFCDPGVPSNDEQATWRPLAGEVWSRAADGPVQLNLPFREPLVGTAGDLPAAVGGARTWSPTARALHSTLQPLQAPPEGAPPFDAVAERFDRQRGVILAGGRSGVAPEAVAELHRLTAWPILADPLSGMRHLDGIVTTSESLLRHRGFADDHAPEVVVRIGRPATSKTLARWVSRCAPVVVQVGGPGVIDPDHDVAATATIEELLAARLTGATGTTWLARWQHAERRADAAIVDALRTSASLDEPAVARVVAEHLPAHVALTVASSMPVRDLEWFGGPRARAHANRGANGIDGVISTALGQALNGVPSAVLVGDLAFVHDANALVGLASRDVDLRIVVVDNDGGGIFSFLPQASLLDRTRFEQLFGTPLGADLLGLAAAHGIGARTVTVADELAAQLAEPGPWMVRVPSERPANVDAHRRLHAAVAAALR
jgi:2-succinyl-5-enolpyruvyl-6-hydroxy-3-cyclohexene-1-carboxylate synthase